MVFSALVVSIHYQVNKPLNTHAHQTHKTNVVRLKKWPILINTQRRNLSLQKVMLRKKELKSFGYNIKHVYLTCFSFCLYKKHTMFFSPGIPKSIILPVVYCMTYGSAATAAFC